MRCAAALLPVLLVGCASGPATSDATGPAEACAVTDCFFEREVRDFDVIDDDTVVVYVGPQRCPFVVELYDVTCDVTFTPAMGFFQTALGSLNRLTPVQGGRICSTTRGLVVYAGVAAPSLLQQQEDVEARTGFNRPGSFPRSGGGFDRSFPVDPASSDVCSVSDIRSITDDELVELLAEVNAPPPPIGEGQLETPEEAPTDDVEPENADANDDVTSEAEGDDGVTDRAGAEGGE